MKLKVLHTSDWHLGQSFMGKSREVEHHTFLTWLLQTIEQEHINVLIVAGDIFDTGTPPNYALERYYNFLTKLAFSSCENIIITAGNHDSIETLKASKQLLKALDIHVISCGDEHQVIGICHYSIDCFSGGEVDLVNLVLCIAISKTLSKLSGSGGVGCLAFDELFSSQGEERRMGDHGNFL